MTVKKISNDAESYLDKAIKDLKEKLKGRKKRDFSSYNSIAERLDRHYILWDNQELWDESESIPQRIEKNLFLFQNCLYSVDGLYSDEEKSLLVQAEADKERSKFEKLKRKFELANSTEVTEATGKPKRRQIPEAVRTAVWRRDQGTCVKCGSRRNLEYDHIIPVIEGGGDTIRNIELLCESCNRSKGAKVQ